MQNHNDYTDVYLLVNVELTSNLVITFIYALTFQSKLQRSWKFVGSIVVEIVDSKL